MSTATALATATLAEVDVTYTDHDDLVHAVTVPCTPLPIPGLVVAPGITGAGMLNGTWTAVHAASGLGINVPHRFGGQFPTKAGATAFAYALAEYFPELDFTAGATEVRETLRHDPFALTAALNDAYRAEYTALTDALATYAGATEVDAFIEREHRLKLAWKSAARGRRYARSDAAHLAAALEYAVAGPPVADDDVERVKRLTGAPPLAAHRITAADLDPWVIR